MVDIAKQQVDLQTASQQAVKVKDSLARLHAFLEKHQDKSQSLDIGKAQPLIEKCKSTASLQVALADGEESSHKEIQKDLEQSLSALNTFLSSEKWFMDDYKSFFDELFQNTYEIAFTEEKSEVLSRSVVAGWHQRVHNVLYLYCRHVLFGSVSSLGWCKLLDFRLL